MAGDPEDLIFARVRALAERRFDIERAGASKQGGPLPFFYGLFQRDFNALVAELGKERLNALVELHVAELWEQQRAREVAIADWQKAQEAAGQEHDARACLDSLLEHELAIIKALARATGLPDREIFARFLPPGLQCDDALWPLIASAPRWRAARAAPARELSRYADLHASPDPGLSAKIASLLASAGPHSVFLFGYRFYPVGQGLFTSGFIARRSGPFHWVYDCGTVSKGSRLEAARAQLHRSLADGAAKRPRLHLVAISHFDADHINGLLDLLRDFSVDILLLPYLTPWERLLVALDENALAGSDFLAFLAAPTAFILGREEFGVGRILLVPPSGEGTAPPEDLPAGEEGGEGPRYALGPLPPEVGEAAGRDTGLGDRQVEMLAAGGALTIGRVWEFLPYNDAGFSKWAKMSPVDREAFCREAQALVDRLKASDVRVDRAGAQAALDDLKTLYDKRFGGRGRGRNIISLFLYGGPLGRARLLAARERHRWLGGTCGLSARRYVRGRHRFGQMMTGDGFLETAERVAAFDAFYRPDGRLERGANFQVMHHGSKHNWSPAVALAAMPLASLFSSEPSTHDHHPDGEVWRDFRPYHRRQIDSRHGWSLVGAFRFE